MTGEKNRYSPLEKLWKLDDETLKTPKHDEMVLFLLSVENLKAFFPLATQFLNSKKCKGTVTEVYSDGSGRGVPWREFFKPTIKIESEKVITTSKNFIVGYFDIVVDFTTDELSDDEWAHYELKWVDYPSHLYIEVKPKIASFGATLRQLRTYQEYEPNAVGNTYLFTGDLRFKDAFESQGVQVIPYNGGEKETNDIQQNIEGCGKNGEG